MNTFKHQLLKYFSTEKMPYQELCECPKILYTRVPNNMAYANNADPDQTASEGAVWSGSTLFAIPLSI